MDYCKTSPFDQVEEHLEPEIFHILPFYTPTLPQTYEVILELNGFGNSGLSNSVIKLVSILLPNFLKL